LTYRLPWPVDTPIESLRHASDASASRSSGALRTPLSATPSC
jgi:hypothetical protein